MSGRSNSLHAAASVLRAAVVLAMAMAAGNLHAGGQHPEDEMSDMHFWDLHINRCQVAEGAVPVLTGSDGAYRLRERDLARCGVTGLASVAEAVSGESYVSTRALPLVDLDLDRQAGRLSLRLRAEAFQRHTVRGREDGQPELSRPVGGALMNYDVFVSGGDGGSGVDTRASALLGGQAFHGPRSLHTQWVLRDIGGSARARRLQTRLRHDDRERALAWTAGDALARGGALAPTVRFAGLQLRRDFDIVPQQRTLPVPAFEGQTELPSTLDLVIDASRRLRQDIPPGPFEVVQSPVFTGAGTAELLVTDSLGREQRISRSFYVNAQALRPGLSDFGFAAGVLRRDFALRSDAYAGLLANGYYRRGLTRWLSGEVIARYRDGRRVAGAALSATIADWAVLDAGLSRGGNRRAGGWLAQLGLQRNARRVSWSVRARAAEPGFGAGLERNAALRHEVAASLSRAFGRLRLGASHLARRSRDSSDFARSTLTAGYSFRHGPSLSLSVFRQTLDGDAEVGARLLLTHALGRQRTVSAAMEGGRQPRYQAQYRRSSVEAIGADWRLGVGGGEGLDDRVSAEFGQRLPVTAYRLRAEQRGADSLYSAAIDGAVGVLGGKRFATRRVQDAVGLVRVPGVAGVPVYRENRLVGHTDARGELVVPGLRGFQPNRMRIGTGSLPLDVRIESDDEVLVPARNSAAVAEFSARHIAAVQLRARRSDGAPVPVGATVYRDGEEMPLPVGREGLVYLESVSAGVMHLRLEWEGGACSMKVTVPVDAGPVPDLGRQSCR